MKSKTRTVIVLLISLSVSLSLTISSAMSWASPNSSFNSAAMKILRELRSFGYERFGILELSTLRDKINQGVPVIADARLATRNSDGRISARWECFSDSKINCAIAVNQPWLDKFPDQKPLLALHEYLGILRFDDSNYWISTSMWFLSLEKAQRVLSSEIKQKIADWIAKTAAIQMNRGERVAGGVVGVGGGGESASLWARMRMLNAALNTLESPRSSQNEKRRALEQIDHNLSSQLAVMWR